MILVFLSSMEESTKIFKIWVFLGNRDEIRQPKNFECFWSLEIDVKFWFKSRTIPTDFKETADMFKSFMTFQLPREIIFFNSETYHLPPLWIFRSGDKRLNKLQPMIFLAIILLIKFVRFFNYEWVPSSYSLLPATRNWKHLKRSIQFFLSEEKNTGIHSVF